MTCSIVARDPATGQLGVGVMSCYFAVGATVPWARAGCGAVATQAFAEPAYGPRCLDAIAAGASADEALASAGAADPMPALRQVGVVAADGTTAAVTGDLCVDHAGKHHGDGYVVVANMMAAPDVWPRAASAFEATPGPLADRLLVALEAAAAAGGDARGAMSAALLVVDGDPAGPSAGKRVDVRVDASADPIGDLRRLLDAAHAYATFDQAAQELWAGHPDAALALVDGALDTLPDDVNLRFLRAGGARRDRLRRPGRRRAPPLGGRAPVMGGGHPGLRREGSGDAAGRSDVLRRGGGRKVNLVTPVPRYRGPR